MINQQKIKLGYIAADPDLQPRTGMNLETIEDYPGDMRRGDKFPPVVVFFDSKGSYWLADGFHRYRAALFINAKTILCEVRRGGKREALLYSVGCNAAHGQRRSNDDKRLPVTKLLKDKEWSNWSDREIARRCHVDHKSVAKLRDVLRPVTGESASERTYRTKHGRTAKMKTGKIGKSRSPTKPKMPPQMKRDLDHHWITSALQEIDEQIASLQKEYPKADQAVTDFPSDHRHVFTSSRLDDMAKWLTDFARVWERTRPPEKTHRVPGSPRSLMDTELET
jgi:hypothetical protein